MLQKIIHFTPLEKKNCEEKKSSTNPVKSDNESSFFDSLTRFIKYNNAAIIILAVVLILGGGALAAGPEAIGQKQTSVEGIDNAALLAVDLATFNMDFKIENIEQDEKYYYVTYSYLDLTPIDSAWQYRLSQRTQKISQKIREDIGAYMAKFLAKHYEARLRDLTEEKSQAEALGAQTRVEVTEYSGLIGRTLDLAAKVFPGYEPVVKTELPPPLFVIPKPAVTQDLNPASRTDNLTQIYNDYVAAHPDLFNAPTPTATASGTPETSLSTATASGTPDSVVPTDTTVPETPATPPAPETPAIPEPESVDIIELPASAPPPAAPVQ